MAEGAGAVVAERDGGQGDIGELGVPIGGEIEHAAIGAVALEGRADFLHGLDDIVVPAPEIGGDAGFCVEGGVGIAGGFGGRGGGDVEFFAVAGERDWTLVTHREGGGEVGSR